MDHYRLMEHGRFGTGLGPAAFLIVLLAFSLAGCGSPPSTAVPASSSTVPVYSSTYATTTATTAPPSSTTSTIPATTTLSLPALTPRQLAGQRVIFSYSGLTPPDSLLEHIRNGEAAGVIFFGENISSQDQIRGVIQVLERTNADPDNPVRAPLLLMTDQEGGKIKRLPGEPSLSAKEVGQSADPVAKAGETGAGAGSNLRAVGMNVNLAPVLDVYREEGDFADKDGRSYSTDPGVVSKLGVAFITAQQEQGVAATAKHFPGLGAAARSQNTDLRPVTLDVPQQLLTARDEFPYEAAIAAGVRLVMVSWAVYPEIDPNRPAGLSSSIVEGQLRNRLDFRGVTITDALGAGALNAFGGFGERAVLAAEAGMDLFICSETDNFQVSQGEQAMSGLEGALQEGALGRADFEEAVRRVIELRSSLADS